MGKLDPNNTRRAYGAKSQYPVSYTHLDVYKRQDTALGKKAGLQLIQTLTLATGSDYASAEINIDWVN